MFHVMEVVTELPLLLPREELEHIPMHGHHQEERPPRQLDYALELILAPSVLQLAALLQKHLPLLNQHLLLQLQQLCKLFVETQMARLL